MPSGAAITNISIACNESYKDKNTGDTVENVEFINVVYFGKLAEIVGEYGRVGMPVYVAGSFTTDKYEKEGQTHYSTKIKGREFNMLASSHREPDNAGQGNQQSQPAQQQNAAPAFSGGDDNAFDDDIPF